MDSGRVFVLIHAAAYAVSQPGSARDESKSDGAGGDADDLGAIGDISNDGRAGANDTATTNGAGFEDARADTDPAFVADRDMPAEPRAGADMHGFAERVVVVDEQPVFRMHSGPIAVAGLTMAPAISTVPALMTTAMPICALGWISVASEKPRASSSRADGVARAVVADGDEQRILAGPQALEPLAPAQNRITEQFLAVAGGIVVEQAANLVATHAPHDVEHDLGVTAGAENVQWFHMMSSSRLFK